MSTDLIVIISIGALCIANAWVCVGVLRSPWYSSMQMALQCALVWFLPVIGLIIVWCVLQSHSNTQHTNLEFQTQKDQGVGGGEFNHPGVSGSGES
ncbi:MAG: hypothetical protein JWN13_2252 [Betaproteobacteria bacterium]|nr:hypothetical protein [Betaproteobacteria bacterium]